MALLTLSGCTSTTDGPPRLALSVDPTTFQWGSVTDVSIENLEDRPVAAPVSLRFTSANGTAVRTFDDVTRGHGLPGLGHVSVAWNGSDDSGALALWGAYTITLEAAGVRTTADVVITEPPTFALTIDAVPREAPAGTPLRFVANNTGNQPLRGALEVLAGRDGTLLFRGTADVDLAPGGGWTFFWDGRRPDGRPVEPAVYALGARLVPADGRSEMTATDWFRAT